MRKLIGLAYLLFIVLMCALCGCRSTMAVLQESKELNKEYKIDNNNDTTNILVNVKLSSDIASVKQYAYLYTHYRWNEYLLDSAYVDGNNYITLKGYLPFQNKVDLIFEKKGPLEMPMILTPGDSITIILPKELQVSYENLIDIPQLRAQKEWNDFKKTNKNIRNRIDSTISLIVQTPQNDTLTHRVLAENLIKDSLALHQMFASMGHSSSPYIANFSLMWLNADYHEHNLYKKELLEKFPNYTPILDSYHLIEQNKRNSESLRVKNRMAQIRHNRTSILQKAISEQKEVKIGDYLDIMLHGEDDSIHSIAMYKGKYLLVEVWASWCKPCIERMRSLIATQKAYADTFEICAISLDRLPGAWKNRIKLAHLESIKHYIGVDFNTGEMYPDISKLGITSIPQNYLLDCEGRIIDININSKELVKRLKEQTTK